MLVYITILTAGSQELVEKIVDFLLITHKIDMYGELAERFKAPSWKGGVGNPYRGFESHVLRHI